MRKPDRTKNRSTPRSPYLVTPTMARSTQLLASICPTKWKTRTIVTAKPRSPSSPGRCPRRSITGPRLVTGTAPDTSAATGLVGAFTRTRPEIASDYCGDALCGKPRSLKLQTAKVKDFLQERRDAREFRGRSASLQFLLQHQQQSEEAGIDGLYVREIERDLLPGCGGLAKGGDCPVHMLGIGGGRKAQGDGFRGVGLSDDKVLLSLISELHPPRPKYERQHVGKQQAQHCAPVIPIPLPKVRFLLDAPQPLQSELSHQGGSPLHRASLKIEGGTEMGPDRNLQAETVALQPQVSLLTTQRYDEEIRTTRIDLTDDVIAAHLVHRAESRIVPPDDLHTAPLAVQRPGRQLGDALGTSKQEYLQRLRGADFGLERVEDIRSGRPALD